MVNSTIVPLFKQLVSLSAGIFSRNEIQIYLLIFSVLFFFFFFFSHALKWQMVLLFMSYSCCCFFKVHLSGTHEWSQVVWVCVLTLCVFCCCCFFMFVFAIWSGGGGGGAGVPVIMVAFIPAVFHHSFNTPVFHLRWLPVTYTAI